MEGLVAWAAEEFKLNRPDKGGTTLRQHYQAAGVHEPNPQPFPDDLAYLWEWFVELSSGRSSGMGPSAISWSDLSSWCLLTRRRPCPWEIRAIRAMDSAFLTAASQEK